MWISFFLFVYFQFIRSDEDANIFVLDNWRELTKDQIWPVFIPVDLNQEALLIVLRKGILSVGFQLVLSGFIQDINDF